MRLYIVRHADAVNGPIDKARTLSGRGKRQMRAVANLLQPLQIKVRAIWHSGLVRADQSARLLAPVVQSEHGIVEREGLAPTDKPAIIIKEITRCAADLMIVGHEPHLGKLASKLLTAKASADIIRLRKGSALCLELSAEDHWQLQWQITPELAGSK